MNNIRLKTIVCIFCLAGLTSLAGCAGSSYTTQGAAKGAARGAAAGAVGGIISALVFGGDVGDAAARGAVVGGTVGAVSGGVAGSRQDKAVAARKEAERQAQQTAELEQLKSMLGEDAFNGLEALTDCKHDVAYANAREAGRSPKPDFALAGLWVEALTEADRQKWPEARALFSPIKARDRDIQTETDFDGALKEALSDLADVRREYGMAATCNK